MELNYNYYFKEDLYKEAGASEFIGNAVNNFVNTPAVSGAKNFLHQNLNPNNADSVFNEYKSGVKTFFKQVGQNTQQNGIGDTAHKLYDYGKNKMYQNAYTINDLGTKAISLF